MAYRRVLINIPEELLEEVDQAASREHRKRNEFVREALRDRIGRSAFKASLDRLRAEAANTYSEVEVDHDIAEALSDARETSRAGSVT